ncbi:hypothetical protein, partial [Candidatus Thiosymbion oneisti]|uniref:hypothetical protein n=1 Tax=Candidatus Thiosymbion oneisti TaxID=589554 RepID=UPI001C401C7C
DAVAPLCRRTPKQSGIHKEPKNLPLPLNLPDRFSHAQPEPRRFRLLPPMNANQRRSVAIGSSSSTVLDSFALICVHLRITLPSGPKL